MTNTCSPNWGDWLISRARVIGFRRQKDIAQAVGCTEDMLSRWRAMPTPPLQMRKGFDTQLCRALKTSPQTLFTDYTTIAPDAAPIIDGTKPTPENDRPIRREVAAALELLSGDRLRALATTAKALVATAA